MIDPGTFLVYALMLIQAKVDKEKFKGRSEAGVVAQTVR